jgi:hypothetical protein
VQLDLLRHAQAVIEQVRQTVAAAGPRLDLELEPITAAADAKSDLACLQVTLQRHQAERARRDLDHAHGPITAPASESRTRHPHACAPHCPPSSLKVAKSVGAAQSGFRCRRAVSSSGETSGPRTRARRHLLCIALWIRAKTVDQEERGNAERRALFVGLWPPMFWLMGDALQLEERAARPRLTLRGVSAPHAGRDRSWIAKTRSTARTRADEHETPSETSSRRPPQQARRRSRNRTKLLGHRPALTRPVPSDRLTQRPVPAIVATSLSLLLEKARAGPADPRRRRSSVDRSRVRALSSRSMVGVSCLARWKSSAGMCSSPTRASCACKTEPRLTSPFAHEVGTSHRSGVGRSPSSGPVPGRR